MQGKSNDDPVVLDAGALLGVNQIGKISDLANEAALGRVLSKIGEPNRPSTLARLLSKIGEGPL